MALTEGKKNSGSSISLKLVAEVWPTKIRPKFVVKDKDTYQLTDSEYTEISWVLKSIETTNNWKTWIKEVKGFKFVIQDWEERYYVDTTLSNASKDLGNSLLANIGKELVISLYINKTEYPTASVKTKDWNFVETFVPYNELDKEKLWLAIKSQEVKKEDKGLTVEDLPDFLK
jgi:hypothetical protein